MQQLQSSLGSSPLSPLAKPKPCRSLNTLQAGFCWILLDSGLPSTSANIGSALEEVKSWEVFSAFYTRFWIGWESKIIFRCPHESKTFSVQPFLTLHSPINPWAVPQGTSQSPSSAARKKIPWSKKGARSSPWHHLSRAVRVLWDLSHMGAAPDSGNKSGFFFLLFWFWALSLCKWSFLTLKQKH